LAATARHEILNGVFAGRKPVGRIALGFFPRHRQFLLRDFSKDGAEASMRLLGSQTFHRFNPSHALRGEVYSFNLLSVGFTADVAALTNRLFKPLGHLGYFWSFCPRRAVAPALLRPSLRSDQEWNERRSLFLTFNNSKYTGGTMLIGRTRIPPMATSNLCSGTHQQVVCSVCCKAV